VEGDLGIYFRIYSRRDDRMLRVFWSAEDWRGIEEFIDDAACTG